MRLLLASRCRSLDRLSLLGLLVLGLTLHAESPLPDVARLKSSPVLQHLKPNPIPTEPRSPAEQTLTQMYVPEGFRVELVAAEPRVRQPVAFAFDERGRIWVAEAFSYPQRQPDGKGLDDLVILEDVDGDGHFESRKVFATGLNLISGFEIGHGGVWVGAAPQLLFIPDANHDDVPDSVPRVLLDGFGYQDTHECLNSFMWGPDGWLYGNQGVFNYAKIGKPGAPDKDRTELRAGVWRYHPTRHEFEVFAHGGSNPWGLDYDERGQIFMTHCRSYWGRGLTTHVIQGGHFWNQANANHAPFIIGDPPSDFPEFRNYLLASARYDHGAGGAGPKGSDAIYGGHSHVGTMIYLGDNWPESYRGHLFTHNLPGHQFNQQVNRPLGSGFDTVHAGKDLLFCSDPSYVAIDLQYGPDGAVYVIDWYDRQHCHNPITERWDRANGRIYRIQHAASFKPTKVNLAELTDLDLVSLQSHKNHWYRRTSRRVLAERAERKTIAKEAVQALLAQLRSEHPLPTRLGALWALHGIKQAEPQLLPLLSDSDDTVRAWAIQLAAERKAPVSDAIAAALQLRARTDPSPVTRLYLASASQRTPESLAFSIQRELAQRADDAQDRNLPYLLWHGMAPLMARNPAPFLEVARSTPIPSLALWIRWYGARLGGDALNQVVKDVASVTPDNWSRNLSGIELATSTLTATSPPTDWNTSAKSFLTNPDPALRRKVERLAATFGDQSMLPRLRELLARTTTPIDERTHAFNVLARALDSESIPIFLNLLVEPRFTSRVLPLLGRFNDVRIAPAILTAYPTLAQPERSVALNTLTSRTSLALALLDAVGTNQIKRDHLTAFHVRQLTQLQNPEVDRKVEATWGRILKSPSEKLATIASLEKMFTEAPLWAYDASEGRKHFQKLCASCHKLGNEGNRVGPELTGAGANGIRYYLENIVDPDAVIGTDFQLTTMETKQGDVLGGLLISENADSLTLRTTTEQVVIAKRDIVKRGLSEKSLMPEGLLEAIPTREQIELLKFLAQP